MKRIKWFGLVGLFILLHGALWSLGTVQASTDKYYITIPQQTIVEITPSQLEAVPPGGDLKGAALFNILVGVPGQGNNGNPYILTWRIEPPSGTERHIPNAKVNCKVDNHNNAVDAIGDQRFTGQLSWEIPGNTPPGEYRYRITFVVNMGAQGHGAPCTETMEIVLKIPGYIKLWTAPGRIGLIYMGPDNIGSKEDRVYVYISCNTPWVLKYRLSNPSTPPPIDVKIVEVSSGITGLIDHWTSVPRIPTELALGPAMKKGWILLQLRANPICSLKTGSYPFDIGFELEAR